MQKSAPSGRLTALELSAIDFAITSLEAAGHSINDVSKDDNPRQQQAEAWMDAHHPFAELTDRDREIIVGLQTDACIPTVQMYLVTPNVPSMGADWSAVGVAEGEWLANYAKENDVDPATTQAA